MKILVTGGAGFIGSHVVDLYILQGHDVVVVDNLSTGRAANVHPAATFYQCSILDSCLDQIFEREHPDVVNHHAAQMDVRRSVADPMGDAEINILGSLHLIELSKKNLVKQFIYISSGGAVYGEPEFLPCDESHPVNPICPYGVSKHTVEHYLYLYDRNYGLPYTIFRYPNVYGPRQNPKGEAGVVSIFAGNLLSDVQVVINGDGEQLRDYVYVKDCARANLLVLGIDRVSGIYNLGTGCGTSVNEIFSRLKNITGSNQQPIYGPAKIGETRQIYLDASKARQVLNWKPEFSLEAGLEQTVSYIGLAEQLV